MFSVISGGQDPEARNITVQDLIALDSVTAFTVDDRAPYLHTRTHVEVRRGQESKSTTITTYVAGQESRVRVADEALDTVIRALEQVRAVRDRKARPVGLAEPLIDDEPSDDAGPSMARGHAAIETLADTPDGAAFAKALEAQAARRRRTGEGPVAA